MFEDINKVMFNVTMDQLFVLTKLHISIASMLMTMSIISHIPFHFSNPVKSPKMYPREKNNEPRVGDRQQN